MQAPQTPAPQPNFVPVRSSSSRRIPEQRHVWVAAELAALAVHVDGWHVYALPFSRRPRMPPLPATASTLVVVAIRLIVDLVSG